MNSLDRHEQYGQKMSSKEVIIEQDILLVSLFALTVFIVSCAVHNSLVSILSVLTFFGYLIYIAVRKFDFLMKYLYFIIIIAMNIIGVFACEYSNIFLEELQSFSGFAGSLPTILLSRWTFVFSLLLFDSKQANSNTDNNEIGELKVTDSQRRVMIWASVFVLILCLLALLDVTRYPAAFLENVNRYRWRGMYSSHFLPGFVFNVLNELVAISILGLRVGNKKISIITIVLYVIYLAWVGNKFGDYFQLIYIFVLVYFDRLSGSNLKNKVKTVLIGTAAFFALVYGASVIQAEFIASGDISANDYLALRVAEQGQLWWKTYLTVDGEMHPEEFSYEIEAALFGDRAISNNVGEQYGMYKIMYLTAPADLVNKKIAAGSHYTEASYAVIYYYFGFMGCIVFSFIMSWLVSIVIRLLRQSFVDKSLLAIIILIHLTFVMETCMASVPLAFLRISSIACVFALWYLLTIRKSRSTGSVQTIIR